MNNYGIAQSKGGGVGSLLSFSGISSTSVGFSSLVFSSREASWLGKVCDSSSLDIIEAVYPASCVLTFSLSLSNLLRCE